MNTTAPLSMRWIDTVYISFAIQMSKKAQLLYWCYTCVCIENSSCHNGISKVKVSTLFTFNNSIVQERYKVGKKRTARKESADLLKRQEALGQRPKGKTVGARKVIIH